MRDRAINHALQQANLSQTIVSRHALSGGCIFNVESLTLEDGMIVVAKTGSRAAENIFQEEAAGLIALAETNTVLVARPLAVGCSDDAAAVIMSYIELGHANAKSWQSFGEDLAKLHASDVGTQYGFAQDNHIGATLQPNGWMNDWVEFNCDRRIGYQTKLAAQRNLLNKAEVKRLEELCNRLEDILPRQPKPALLHGDLWSGNALVTANGRIALIDPAVSIGDGWADIAMMRLFGGFPDETFDAYRASMTEQKNVDERIAVYQLYHVLNHLNLFGRGYIPQVMRLLDQLGC